MNMLPIKSEWKRRIKWAEKQKKQQKSAGKASGQVVVRREPHGK
jgi:hypothetical protein